MKFFNTAGPVNPERHYYIAHRLPEKDMYRLIEQNHYFVLHAPRQSGKTTAIRIFMQELNRSGKYYALYINVEPAQVARDNVEKGMFTLLHIIKSELQKVLPASKLLEYFQNISAENISGHSLQECLEFLSVHTDKPMILFIDEIDSLVSDTLISVLRQLRSGYVNRPEHFPQSVCLVGVRDVRDYKIWSSQEHNFILGGSAFNIKAESLVLANFSLDQVRNLYHQHTQETGQIFTDESIEYAYYITQGQPWLVNALAYQVCFKDVTDRLIVITKHHIELAKETLIIRRDTHIDVLIDRLKEPRVRSIIDAIISGQTDPKQFATDDVSYVIDLGLVTQKDKNLVIANSIYQEIIPRELSHTAQFTIHQTSAWYITPEGRLDMHKLLLAFVDFYRQNSAVWLEKFDYKESGPHILLMAFLQRIINGGGTIYREYALGRGRVDLLIEYKTQKIVIELKVNRGQKTLDDGLRQTADYMDANGSTEGHLVIFDRQAEKPWSEKIYTKECTVGTHTISVWGL